jgi:RNA polymerase sigma-70 factor (ECF subfamily)
MKEYDLLIKLKQGDKTAFSSLFNKYYKDMVLYGGNILQNQALSEDVVQNVFLKLWKDRDGLEIKKSLKSYLLRSVHNGCLDEIRHKGIVRNFETYKIKTIDGDNLYTEDYVLYSDLKNNLDEAISKLPLQCREAFEMNRIEGLKYREIAEKLNVSERTIEVRIGKALGLLRINLQEFFLCIFLIWVISKK